MFRLRQALCYRHSDCRTQQAYCGRILCFIEFHGGWTHPKDMGMVEIDPFVSRPATDLKFSASTRHQAVNALAFRIR